MGDKTRSNIVDRNSIVAAASAEGTNRRSTPRLTEVAAKRSPRHHRAMRLGLSLALVSLVAASTPAALAQTEPSASGLKMAQDLVEEGRALGQQGKWGDALQRFQRAESLSGRSTPQLEFYIGYAEARTGKLVAANVDLHRAIELAHAAHNEQVAKAAQAELPDLDARTPTLTITVNGAAAPQSLHIDGSSIGVAAVGGPVPLDPGKHAIVVGFAGGPVTKEVTLTERQRATVAVDAPLETAAAVPTPQPTPQPPVRPEGDAYLLAPPPSKGSALKTTGIVLTAAGGATLIAGGVFYLLARSSMSSVTNACPSSPCTLPPGSSVESDYHTAQSRQTISIVLSATGGALAAGGVVLLLVGGGHASGATSTGVAPWLGPGGGGAVLRGSF
jgi:hypothetical protein